MATASPKDPTSFDVRMGQRVRALRLAQGLSQTDLANALGVTFQQVQKYESGRNRIAGGRLERLAKLFNIEPARLFGSNGVKQGDQTLIERFLADNYGTQIATAYLSIEDHKTRRYVAESIKTLARGAKRLKK
jgi:transcriptional regulator with XRE-family HTH domain